MSLWPIIAFSRSPQSLEVVAKTDGKSAKQTTASQAAALSPIARHSIEDPCSCCTPLLLDGQSASSSRGSSRHSQAVAQGAQDNTEPQRPKLLVCHDMMGGYLPGEALLGGVDCPDNYRLWHWDCVDVFVYFSHHMVTIPPRGWTHAAHQHGVRMLGTFITEFGQGKLRSEVLFASRDSAEVVANQLVAVALHYGFEGWLVSVLQHFVGYLRARMQAELPGRGLVVWMPSAGARQSEVYMGVDVFGRGSYGGGGHNVGLALRAAAAAGLSAALFAPGWVLENLDRTKFAELQERWWQQVQAEWGFSHAVVHSLPFHTAFNAGAGRGWFKGGALVAQGSTAAAVAASAAGVVFESCGSSGKSNDSAEDISNQAALAAVEAATVPTIGVAAQPGKGWFNMLLTDTLPNSRDPITQQVVCGPVVARLVASTAYEGGSCMVLCQRRKQQLPSRGPGVQCTTCPGPQSAASCSSSSSSHSTNDGAGRPVALLQLFRTSVAVGQGVVGVRAVYGARDRSSASLAAFGSVGSLSSSTDGGSSSDALKAQAVPLGLWIMVEKEDAAYHDGGASTAVAAAAGASMGSGTGEACRKLLLLPTEGAAPDGVEQHLQQAGTAVGLTSEAGLAQHSAVQPAFSQQKVQLGGGTLSDVIIDWASPAVVQQAGAFLHPVEFVAAQQQEQQQQQKLSDVVCISADQLWDMDLSRAICGWMWKQAAWKVSVPAGSRITGIGVAVEVVPESCIASELLITGMLGKIELSYVDLNMALSFHAINVPAVHVSACTSTSSSRGNSRGGRVVAHGILDSYRKERGLPIPTEEAQKGLSNCSSTTTTTTTVKQRKPQPSNRSWVDQILGQSQASASSMDGSYDDGDVPCPVECVLDVYNDNQLQAIFEEAGPTALVVVDFYKTACGACKYIMPGFIKLCQASANGHRSDKPPVVFAKHNVFDEDEGSVTALAKKYNIRSVPRFVFFKNGVELESFATRDKEKVAAAILKHAEPGSVEFGDWQ
eukprot:gene11568-11712_t